MTVKGADAKASTKRPDIVLYINGIALGVLELKRSTVSVSEGIRQNLDNQKVGSSILPVPPPNYEALQIAQERFFFLLSPYSDRLADSFECRGASRSAPFFGISSAFSAPPLSILCF